ncbi:MAG: hypothetical protein CMF59_10715 [Leptospiraceae bacterium]|nr:hypothetical protein [Leptospiraceae bacterium]
MGYSSSCQRAAIIGELSLRTEADSRPMRGICQWFLVFFRDKTGKVRKIQRIDRTQRLRHRLSVTASHGTWLLLWHRGHRDQNANQSGRKMISLPELIRMH